MPVLTPAERVGTVLDGKYRLERILGEGGFGVVFAATHVGLARPVAIKLLHANLSDQAEVVSRFLREARATSALRHPNVIDVRDVVTSPEHGIYMVLELLEGEPLSSLLERRQVLDLRETLAHLGPVIDAMRAAHAAGIVHRDIKPDNVFLSRGPGGDVVPKLLDFGIAKLADVGPGMATATGLVLGTPIYMAPEQAMGRTKEIGPASDVWSMAVMLYECLTGRFPFDLPPEPSPTAVVLEVVTGRIVPVRERRADLPPAVGDVLGRALERPVERRLSSMGELLETLERAASELAPTGRPPPSPAALAQVPPTLLSTGPLEAAARGPGGADVSAPPLVARGATGPLVPTMLATGPGERAHLSEAAQRTGPIPGSGAATSARPEAVTTGARMLAELRAPSRVPTWAWALGALGALAGIVGMAALAMSREGPRADASPARAEEPAPASPSAASPEPLVVPPTRAVAGTAATPEIEVAGTALPEGEPPPATAEAPPAAAARSSGPRSRTPAPAPVAATPRAAPGAVPAAEPAPTRDAEEPTPRSSAVVHRASDVSLDDF